MSSVGFTSFQPSAIGGPGPSSSASQRKRSASPVKLPKGGGGGEDGRPAKMQRPGPTESLLNIRAEEEAARRINAGRVYNGASGSGTRAGDQGRFSDLFGKTFLRERVGRLTRDQGVSLNDEALTYLSQAAEQRLRALLTSSLRAQAHRTKTSHHRPPPLTSGSSTTPGTFAEDDESARPMWSHVVTSDVNATIDALTRQNKQVELGSRAARMVRKTRNAEIARMREAREARARENGEFPVEHAPGGNTIGIQQGDGMEVDQAEDPAPQSTSALPATPRDKPAATATTSTPTTSSATPSAPVFGAVKERAPPSVTTTAKKGKKKDVSAETAHKMSNMTAIRATGQKMGKYAWLNNAPNVSSPLAGRKKKDLQGVGSGLKKGGGEEIDADGEVDGDQEDEEGTEEGGTGMKRSRSVDGADGLLVPGETGQRKKSKLSQSTTAADGAQAGKKKRRRPKVSIPARRLVPVYPLPGSSTTPTPAPLTPIAPTPTAEFGPIAPKVDDRRLVPDDQALTAVDVMFALEREGTGRGMETAEEVVWKYQGRFGGIWGKDPEVVAPVQGMGIGIGQAKR